MERSLGIYDILNRENKHWTSKRRSRLGKTNVSAYMNDLPQEVELHPDEAVTLVPPGKDPIQAIPNLNKDLAFPRFIRVRRPLAPTG